ncbi:uncharacterized protein BDZ99DRAFT_521152 [Mytilinidion resinicola]|uniref:Uncharacterized protein n=1 Tax=Mytilinidion resinicola TaxID=574789 RepID=A0A6A6YPP1_9PEZI|nr:uncharacterized protein BDZ99DRAFT_521152 [Mytilinidion resinicola]KAF2809837.1 hypothetical protein BDZ99DRAFT_521152 [Mytilinidion resinicola]
MVDSNTRSPSRALVDDLLDQSVLRLVISGTPLSLRQFNDFLSMVQVKTWAMIAVAVVITDLQRQRDYLAPFENLGGGSIVAAINLTVNYSTTLEVFSTAFLPACNDFVEALNEFCPRLCVFTIILLNNRHGSHQKTVALYRRHLSEQIWDQAGLFHEGGCA